MKNLLNTNLTGLQAAKFIRSHVGKIYVDVTTFGGDDYLRIAAVKSDLIQKLEWAGDSDGVRFFEDDGGNTVLGYTY